MFTVFLAHLSRLQLISTLSWSPLDSWYKWPSLTARGAVPSLRSAASPPDDCSTHLSNHLRAPNCPVSLAETETRAYLCCLSKLHQYTYRNSFQQRSSKTHATLFLSPISSFPHNNCLFHTDKHLKALAPYLIPISSKPIEIQQ